MSLDIVQVQRVWESNPPASSEASRVPGWLSLEDFRHRSPRKQAKGIGGSFLEVFSFEIDFRNIKGFHKEWLISPPRKALCLILFFHKTLKNLCIHCTLHTRCHHHILCIMLKLTWNIYLTDVFFINLDPFQSSVTLWMFFL